MEPIAAAPFLRPVPLLLLNTLPPSLPASLAFARNCKSAWLVVYFVTSWPRLISSTDGYGVARLALVSDFLRSSRVNVRIGQSSWNFLWVFFQGEKISSLHQTPTSKLTHPLLHTHSRNEPAWFELGLGDQVGYSTTFVGTPLPSASYRIYRPDVTDQIWTWHAWHDVLAVEAESC